jgi:transposase/IS5 family transposase
MDPKTCYNYGDKTKKQENGSMESITKILGGSQMLLGVSYEIQDVFEEYLTEEHRTFLAMLRVLDSTDVSYTSCYQGRGRMPYEDQPMIRAFLARHFFKIESTTELLLRLKSDSNLRRICGFEKVPSESTFSRRMKKYSEKHLMEQILVSMVSKSHEGTIVGHISRDSTAIIAREKPVNKKKEVKPEKKKRGRPKKGEMRFEKPPKRLTRQIKMKAHPSIKELNQDCSWGCKQNSQGNIQFWKGYKLHLDVTDMGIPVSAVVTGANVHDSQVSLPLEKMSEKRVIHLYSLMDAAYDAPEIREYSQARGRIALIDQNKRRKDSREPMDPAQKARFKIRSTVERTNSHLKDWLLPAKLLVKGFRKVNFVLMAGVVCLAALKILQQFILPTLHPDG